MPRRISVRPAPITSFRPGRVEEDGFAVAQTTPDPRCYGARTPIRGGITTLQPGPAPCITENGQSGRPQWRDSPVIDLTFPIRELM